MKLQFCVGRVYDQAISVINSIPYHAAFSKRDWEVGFDMGGPGADFGVCQGFVGGLEEG